ncbi:hypothetical protein FRC12_022525 [Ceratobasidium sp. 428]|nr:hypothetical protein FRC12_022525 [Ceratobasidium sp. 428]
MAPLASTTAYARTFQCVCLHHPNHSPRRAASTLFNGTWIPIRKCAVATIQPGPPSPRVGLPVPPQHPSTLPPPAGIRLRGTHIVTETTPKEHAIGLCGFGDSGEGVGVHEGTRPLLRPSQFSPTHAMRVFLLAAPARQPRAASTTPRVLNTAPSKPPTPSHVQLPAHPPTRLDRLAPRTEAPNIRHTRAWHTSWPGCILDTRPIA